jgi:hypothetical protein
MDVSEDAVLEHIHFVLYGKPLEFGIKSRFFKDLGIYQRALERAGDPTVSLPAIRSWLRDGGSATRPTRTAAMRFLRGFLLWMTANEPAVPAERKAVLEAVIRLLSRYDTVASAATPSAAAGRSPRDAAKGLNPIIGRAFQNLLLASDRISRQVDRDLFRDSSSKEGPDHSYFLMFRHSTNRGAILKSFLVCQKPEPAVVNSYGFNMFIWGGQAPEFHGHIFRETEGLILKSEKSYYLLGYDFSVPVDKRRDPQEYGRLRPFYREHPNGMGLTSIEYDDIDQRPGLFGGVTMTVAAGRQPVIARVAFLHLGTSSRMGAKLSDHIVQPTELYDHQLSGDLRRTVERMQAAGCTRYGIDLEQRVQSRNWRRGGPSRLARRLTEMIANLPAWDQAQLEASESALPMGRGAIESYGHLRD